MTDSFLEKLTFSELAHLREQLDQDREGESGDEINAAAQLNQPQHWLENPPPVNDSQQLVNMISSLADAAAAKEAKRPCPKQDAPKSPPKGYPENRDQYADPENYKYPLDTENHVRTALCYFSKGANRSGGGYSPEEQKFMWRRILAAAKKHGIKLSPDVEKRGEALGSENDDNDSKRDEKVAGGNTALDPMAKFKERMRRAGYGHLDHSKFRGEAP